MVNQRVNAYIWIKNTPCILMVGSITFRFKNQLLLSLTAYSITKLTSSTTNEPQCRCSRRVHQTKIVVDKWRTWLEFQTIEVTKANLAKTINLIQTLQAETREYMKNHYKRRVLEFRPRIFDDVMCSDTLFSNITSSRDYKCFKIFANKFSKLERIELMCREANDPD